MTEQEFVDGFVGRINLKNYIISLEPNGRYTVKENCSNAHLTLDNNQGYFYASPNKAHKGYYYKLTNYQTDIIESLKAQARMLYQAN